MKDKLTMLLVVVIGFVIGLSVAKVVPSVPVESEKDSLAAVVIPKPVIIEDETTFHDSTYNWN